MLAHAPAPVEIGGVRAVPVHVTELRASVVLDAARRVGSVDAVLTYRVGTAAGCPLLDLRQVVDEVWVDGRRIAPTRFASYETGEGPYATVRVLEAPQAAGSTHALRLRYRLGRPRSDLGGAYPPVLGSRGGRVRWSFGMADLFDGRHLEMWFPANLPFDQFPFVLDLRLTGTATAHTLITNGTVAGRGANAWRVAFPAWFTAVSALVELRPSEELEHVRRRVELPASGRIVTVDGWRERGRPEDLGHQTNRIVALIRRGETLFGPFPGDRFTCLFHGAAGGMEYAGATTTSPDALAHEVLHSWFARGVLPAADVDGWWDEAFTTWVTGGAVPVPLEAGRPPVALCSRRPFQRHTHPAAYAEGSRVFAGLAADAGRTAVLEAMGALFRARARTCVSTAELEEHLALVLGPGPVTEVFRRFVYGFDDTAASIRPTAEPSAPAPAA